ncbi:TPA: hypothetical protein HA235_04440 [Candidatus Woesearchaeota archaeon]|nr:hypothetical protein [Candidatus Woesearchaeota archaeon]HIH31931.1 hypothetical protein [Candidatus Woesearchaeota archaeon]HIH55499.1 hypothetical protein [Candidatus Woesearchaeota archaeon]HIJ01056.1 hypothetical protein [Candidatus Woesearchaeota archaeon]HIJ14719.1 hypothetical protein [Candidatus Woesearchaeota archaeon]
MSVFGESIQFLAKLGIYDVVLPFLLVFTIVFSLMEKTKVLGTEKGKDDKEYTRKNMNAMVAFVTAFLVVASAQLVAVINKTLSQIFILLLLIVCFLMLAGSFHQQTKEGFFLTGTYKNIFMVIVFVSIIAIFLNALGWLDVIYNYLKDNWNTSYVAAVILMIAIIGFMAWIMHDPSDSKDAKKEGTG